MEESNQLKLSRSSNIKKNYNNMSSHATTKRIPTTLLPSKRYGAKTRGHLANSLLLSAALLISISLVLILSDTTRFGAEAFVKFGYVLNSTACDTCDDLLTYSGRNVFCCLAKSKCCQPNSLDELDALTTQAPERS